MANPEKSQSVNFVDDMGNKAVTITRITPKDHSFENLKLIVEETFKSAQNGESVRIHIVFPQTTTILTDRNLRHDRNPEELERFKEIYALHIAYSQEAFILKSPISRADAFEKFINNQVDVSGI